MSETKQVTGICQEISERGEWSTFHIDVGTQYPVKLSTKQSAVIELARAAAKAKQLAVWTYAEQESEKVNPNSGKPYVNRYLNKVEVGGSEDPSVYEDGSEPGAPAKPPYNFSPLLGGDKDRAITRMSCLRTAVELHGPLNPAAEAEDVEPLLQSVIAVAARLEQWVYRDLDDLPF